MEKIKNKGGRPIAEIKDRLCCSVNVRLCIDDYCDLQNKARKVGVTPSAYVRSLISKGVVKAPFSKEELRLLRTLAGEANNLNQLAKHLNQGAKKYALSACLAAEKIKNILDDCKKY